MAQKANCWHHIYLCKYSLRWKRKQHSRSARRTNTHLLKYALCNIDGYACPGLDTALIIERSVAGAKVQQRVFWSRLNHRSIFDGFFVSDLADVFAFDLAEFVASVFCPEGNSLILAHSAISRYPINSIHCAANKAKKSMNETYVMEYNPRIARLHNTRRFNSKVTESNANG